MNRKRLLPCFLQGLFLLIESLLKSHTRSVPEWFSDGNRIQWNKFPNFPSLPIWIQSWNRLKSTHTLPRSSLNLAAAEWSWKVCSFRTGGNFITLPCLIFSMSYMYSIHCIHMCVYFKYSIDFYFKSREGFIVWTSYPAATFPGKKNESEKCAEQRVGTSSPHYSLNLYSNFLLGIKSKKNRLTSTLCWLLETKKADWQTHGIKVNALVTTEYLKISKILKLQPNPCHSYGKLITRQPWFLPVTGNIRIPASTEGLKSALALGYSNH